MKLYTAHVMETGEELCVAARNSDQCADVFVTFWIARSGRAPNEFYTERGVPAGYRDHTLVLNVAQGDVPGVVVRQRDGSMLFEPVIG